MEIFQQIVVMLATLAILIAFHEYGHFWVARRCGVKVLRFSIGFGTPLFRWQDKQGTEFILSILPLGGYVKMLDERELEEEISAEDKPYAFNNKTVAQRIAIVSAGPIANFILAVLIYWLVFLQGTAGLAPIVFHLQPDSIAEKSGLQTGQEIASIDGVKTTTVQAVALQLIKRVGDSGAIEVQTHYPGSDVLDTYQFPINSWMGTNTEQLDPFETLGIGFYRPVIEPIISEVVNDSAAAEAGLQAGDKLLYADGLRIDHWQQWVDYIQVRANVQIKVVIDRSGIQKELLLTPRIVMVKDKPVGQVGVYVKAPAVPEHLIRKQEYNLLTAWLPALDRTWNMAVFSLQSLKKMILGDISYKQLSGPITIAKVASESADSGIYSYLSLLALLSVSLGVLNLLPIPVLDGGHILFYVIEWIKGGPVPEKVQVFAYQIGIAVVVSIMILAVVNDLGRL